MQEKFPLDFHRDFALYPIHLTKCAIVQSISKRKICP
jgi:hypothetical protein